MDKNYLIHAQIMKTPVLDAERLQEMARRVAELLKRKPQTITSQTLSQTLVKIIKCGDNVTYTLDETGLLTISGKGAVWDFEFDNAMGSYKTPWRNEREMIHSIEIQHGVTFIGRAFSNCDKLKNIHIPDSVTSIEYAAFSGCKELISVAIPENVTSIGNRAFHGCRKLTSVTIPDGVTSIGDFAFAACRELTIIRIPDSVTSIGNCAFDDTGLTGVSVPSKAEIGYTAFPKDAIVRRRK